jgi:hypothetical protein
MKPIVVTITPKQATAYLKMNVCNRRQRIGHVKTLADAMKRGQWKLNGESIKLNGTTLIDGQHRLLACVMSGVPFETVIINDMDAEVFDTIDTGVKRSGADTLHMNGEINTNALAAALSVLGMYKDTGHPRGRNLAYTNQDYERMLELYPSIREHVKVAASHKSKILVQSVEVVLRYLFTEVSQKQSDKFFDQLILGIGLEEGSPVLALRNRLIDNAVSVSKLKKEVTFGLVIVAWNAFRACRKLKSIRYDYSKTGIPQIK